jgi:hypothetical protein
MKRSCHFGIFSLLILSFLIPAIIGCGDNLPKRVPVSGHVFFDGKPLETGGVGIQTTGERASYAALGPGGAFTVSTFGQNDGLMLGKHKVAVSSKEDVNASTIKWLIPKKYADFETSGLEINITGATSDLKIDLTSEPGKKYPLIEKFK